MFSHRQQLAGDVVVAVRTSVFVRGGKSIRIKQMRTYLRITRTGTGNLV